MQLWSAYYLNSRFLWCVVWYLSWNKQLSRATNFYLRPFWSCYSRSQASVEDLRWCGVHPNCRAAHSFPYSSLLQTTIDEKSHCIASWTNKDVFQHLSIRRPSHLGADRPSSLSPGENNLNWKQFELATMWMWQHWEWDKSGCGFFWPKITMF